MSREELITEFMKVYENTPEDERKALDPVMLMMGHTIEFLDYFLDTWSDKDKLIEEVIDNKGRKMKAIDDCLKEAIEVMKGD